MMPTLPSLVAPEFIVTTTSGAASHDKVGTMTTLGFQWLILASGDLTRVWFENPDGNLIYYVFFLFKTILLQTNESVIKARECTIKTRTQ